MWDINFYIRSSTISRAPWTICESHLKRGESEQPYQTIVTGFNLELIARPRDDICLTFYVVSYSRDAAYQVHIYASAYTQHKLN